MAKDAKRLGRGLSSLLSSTVTSPKEPDKQPEDTPQPEAAATSEDQQSAQEKETPASSAASVVEKREVIPQLKEPKKPAPRAKKASESTSKADAKATAAASSAPASTPKTKAETKPKAAPKPSNASSTPKNDTSKTAPKRPQTTVRQSPATAPPAAQPEVSEPTEAHTQPAAAPAPPTKTSTAKPPAPASPASPATTSSSVFTKGRTMLDSVEIADVQTSAHTTPAESNTESTQVLRCTQLVPHPNQPRRSIPADGIAALARSIAQTGVIQPLVVRPRTSGGPQTPATYEIVAGERRWRAAKAAGLNEVPVVIRDLPDEQALEIALVENIQREDLNAIDRAAAYYAYCKEFGLRADEVAVRLGEDRTTVTNYLRLLELPKPVKDMVAEGKLSMGHARCILGIPDDDARIELAIAASENGLSVRALEDIVRRRKTRDDSGEEPQQKKQTKPVHIVDVENRLQRAVGTKVTIKEGRAKNTGRITIEYYSLDDFDRISELLGLPPE